MASTITTGSKTRQRRVSALIALIFVLLTAIGLFTVRDYSMPYDEFTEMGILASNLKEYALCLWGEDSGSYYANLHQQRISESIERDHGICAYYPLAPLYPYLASDISAYSVTWSMLTWLWFMVGCIALYGLMRELQANRAISLVTMLMLYLSPRLFAEGHYNNKDIVLLALVLLTLWLGARFLKKPGALRGALFSLAGAMATNTKIIGALPWGLIGLAALITVSARRLWSRRMVCAAAVTLLSFAGFYALLTPALWKDPLGLIGYLFSNANSFSRFGGIVYFRNAEFYDICGETPLPRYYLPYYILISVPLYTLALSAAGQLAALWRVIKRRTELAKRHDMLMLCVLTLAWVVPLIYAVITRPIVYNGWRHFYFIYAGLVALAGYGAQTVWTAFGRKCAARGLLTGALALCLAFQGIGLIINHPYQFGYLNALYPRDARYGMDLDYWNAADTGAFRRLYNMKKDEPGDIRIGCYFNDIKVGVYKLPKDISERLVITVNPDEDYLYYNMTYVNVFSVPDPPEGYHVLFPVMSYGNTIGVMYERD